MRRSRTTRHEALGNAALFFFPVAVPDEIYTQRQNVTSIFRLHWL